MEGGIPVDVKGCEAWHNIPSEGTRRAGQLILDYNQYKAIVEKHGFYFCIVHIGELVIDYFYVLAEKIVFKNDSQKSVSWRTMRKLAEA